MLFVLRLLPSYKRWQKRVVDAMFLISFLVTLYSCIIFGLSCVPFKANWEHIPGSKCFSKDLLVTTNQVNAGEGSLPTNPSVSGYTLLVLIRPSAFMCVRYCHRHHTTVSTMECADEAKNETTAERSLRTQSDHRSVKHWPSSQCHEEDSDRRCYL